MIALREDYRSPPGKFGECLDKFYVSCYDESMTATQTPDTSPAAAVRAVIADQVDEGYLVTVNWAGFRLYRARFTTKRTAATEMRHAELAAQLHAQLFSDVRAAAEEAGWRLSMIDMELGRNTTRPGFTFRFAKGAGSSTTVSVQRSAFGDGWNAGWHTIADADLAAWIGRTL